MGDPSGQRAGAGATLLPALLLAALAAPAGAQAPPPNDNFADRTAISGPSVVTGLNWYATDEPDEPCVVRTDTCPPGVAAWDVWGSIWWRYTPAQNQTVTLDMDAPPGGFAPGMTVHTGAAPADLVPVAHNMQDGYWRPTLSFAAQAGVEYQIQVYSQRADRHADVPAAEGDPANVRLRLTAGQATTTTLAGSPAGFSDRDLIMLATVRASGGVPGGEVSLRHDRAEIARGTLRADGTAVLRGRPDEESWINLRAVYLGAPGFAGSASAVMQVLISGPAEEFVGGGTVFNLTDACAANGWANGPHPVRLRHSAAGDTPGETSQLAILWPSGSQHLQVWASFAPSTANYAALGRRMWSFFVLQPVNPRVAPVQRALMRPEGAGGASEAEEMMLRLRVVNFDGITGCSATVAGVLHRIGG